MKSGLFLASCREICRYMDVTSIHPITKCGCRFVTCATQVGNVGRAIVPSSKRLVYECDNPSVHTNELLSSRCSAAGNSFIW